MAGQIHVRALLLGHEHERPLGLTFGRIYGFQVLLVHDELPVVDREVWHGSQGSQVRLLARGAAGVRSCGRNLGREVVDAEDVVSGEGVLAEAPQVEPLEALW